MFFLRAYNLPTSRLFHASPLLAEKRDFGSQVLIPSIHAILRRIVFTLHASQVWMWKPAGLFAHSKLQLKKCAAKAETDL